METSAPKRRKTSPTSSVSLHGSDTSVPPSSGEGRRRSNRRPRPSFASPTKSSLARANPEDLERHNAARGERMQERMRGAGRHEVADESFGLILPVDDDLDAPGQSSAPANPPSDDTRNDDADEQAVTAQLEGASENRPASDNSPAVPDVARGFEMFEHQGPIRQPTTGMRGRPRRSTNVPSPRPLPPPSAQEEELLDPFKGRALHRSPPRGVIPAQEPEEPELPPTPTQKGMSDPTAVISSPVGIHKTPSRRPRRSRALADKLRSGSSPLKQPPIRPIDLGIAGKAPTQPGIPILRTISTTTGKPSSRTIKNPTMVGSKDQVQGLSAKLPSVRDSAKPHPARGVEDLDPFHEKKSLQDALRAEARQLEADLAALQRENDRLHISYEQGQATLNSQGQEDTWTVLDVLKRHALPPKKQPVPEPSAIWLEAALDPMSFLPFGQPMVTLPNPFGTSQQEDDSLPLSHHPLPMNSLEELPYLQLFTPLTFHSSVSCVPRRGDDEDETSSLLQQHNISVSSNPRGLFTAKIDMLVNTKTLSISRLSVPKLEPASASELGPLVRKITNQEVGSVMKRNINTLTWAMSEWTRIATKRARFWCQVTEELEYRQDIVDCVQRMRRGKRKKRTHQQTTVSDAESSDEEGHGAKKQKKKYTTSQLLPLLGRTSLDLDLTVDGHEEVELRITWKITFDWAGEGRSTIGVLVQAPGKWHARDDRQSLVGIPRLFDTLLQKGSEPIVALRTIVSLLVGEVQVKI